MQTLNAPPRENLTLEQVKYLLTAPAVEVDFGAEEVDASLNFAVDLTPDLVDGAVKRQMYARVHGTCDLELSRELAWGTALVRPFMILKSSNLSARFNLGVFSLETPVRDSVHESIETYSVTGYDRLYFLDRPVGDTYFVMQGTGYLKAVEDAIAAAGLTGVLLDSTAAAKTLPVTQTWPLANTSTSANGEDSSSEPVTWLDIVNDLLKAIGYRGLWADERGFFRSEPSLSYEDRGEEWHFDVDPLKTILVPQRTFTQDIWKTPNRWVFIQQNRDPAAAAPTEGAGIYTVNDLDSPLTGQTARGIVWTRLVELDAADQTELVARGNRIVGLDKTNSAKLKVSTGPFPVAGHFDVYGYSDGVLPVSRVLATSWSQPLKGGDVEWEWNVVA